MFGSQESITLGRKPTPRDWLQLMLATDAASRLTGYGLNGTWAAINTGAYDVAGAHLRAAMRDARGGDRQSARDHQIRIQSQAWCEWLVAMDLPLSLTEEAGPPPVPGAGRADVAAH